MGDYYKEIANEKNYFYIRRFGGLTVDHVWTSDLEEWKEKEPRDSANTFFMDFMFSGTVVISIK